MKSPFKVFKYIFSDSPLTLKYYLIYFIFIIAALSVFVFSPTRALPFPISELSNVEAILLWSSLAFIYLLLIIMILLLIYKRLETLKLRWVWIIFLIGLILRYLEWEYVFNISHYVINTLIFIPAIVGLLPDKLLED